MATLFLDGKKNQTVQFTDRDGQRRTVRLGKISETKAEKIKDRIEKLNAAAMADVAVDHATAEWLADLHDAMHGKLAAVGLVTARIKPEAVKPSKPATLGLFLDDYIENRNAKDRTKTAYGHVRRNLVAYFGAEKSMAEITPGDAEEFRSYLGRPKAKRGAGLAVGSTVKRRCAIAKQFFGHAVKKKLISENPFGEFNRLTVGGNEAKEFFVTGEMASAVLAACPDAQWRLIFALARFGGLRCPSEHLLLRWGDIDWAKNRFKVHSPKTEHHDGGESREVPIFPELRPYLEQVWDEAPEGTEYVITRYRNSSANLRTQLHRIIRKAGLEPWPKAFNNLRASRETELAETWPIHKVCAWIGNSEAVAKEHYLQITDEDFEQAAGVQADTKSAANGAARPDGTEANGAEWENGAQRKSNKIDTSQHFPTPEIGLPGLLLTQKTRRKTPPVKKCGRKCGRIRPILTWRRSSPHGPSCRKPHVARYSASRADKCPQHSSLSYYEL